MAQEDTPENKIRFLESQNAWYKERCKIMQEQIEVLQKQAAIYCVIEAACNETENPQLAAMLDQLMVSIKLCVEEFQDLVDKAGDSRFTDVLVDYLKRTA